MHIPVPVPLTKGQFGFLSNLPLGRQRLPTNKWRAIGPAERSREVPCTGSRTGHWVLPVPSSHSSLDKAAQEKAQQEPTVRSVQKRAQHFPSPAALLLAAGQLLGEDVHSAQLGRLSVPDTTQQGHLEHSPPHAAAAKPHFP